VLNQILNLIKPIHNFINCLIIHFKSPDFIDRKIIIQIRYYQYYHLKLHLKIKNLITLIID